MIDNYLVQFFCLCPCLLQLTISFNESSLHSTYEYPSESSAWDVGEEDEEEKEDENVADEQPSMVGRIHIPRPSFNPSSIHTTNSNGEAMCIVDKKKMFLFYVFVGNSQVRGPVLTPLKCPSLRSRPDQTFFPWRAKTETSWWATCQKQRPKVLYC